jgi:predicted nucleic acid-binding protein
LSANLLIPVGVIAEVRQGTTDDTARQWLNQVPSDWIVEVPHIHATVAAWNLGRGETEVLSFAAFNPGYAVVIDDLAARNCAMSLHLPMLGTLGILLLAKKDGLIDRIAPHVRALQAADMRLSPSVVERALMLAGE